MANTGRMTNNARNSLNIFFGKNNSENERGNTTHHILVSFFFHFFFINLRWIPTCTGLNSKQLNCAEFYTNVSSRLQRILVLRNSYLFSSRASYFFGNHLWTRWPSWWYSSWYFLTIQVGSKPII